MSVLTQSTARGDVLLRPGITNEWAIRWERSEDAGATFHPQKWDDWSAQLELRSPQGDLWHSAEVSLEPGGLARVLLPAGALTATEWHSRGHGRWLVNATHSNGRTERLGDGYFYLEAQ